MKTISLFLMILVLDICLSQKSHADEEEGGSIKIGPDQAITKFDPDGGIQLSDVASKTIGIRFKRITGNGSFIIPKDALVHHQDELGIYRYRNQWFKLVPIQILSKSKTEARIKSDELKSTDQFVDQGVALLRVADLEASSGGAGDHH